MQEDLQEEENIYNKFLHDLAIFVKEKHILSDTYAPLLLKMASYTAIASGMTKVDWENLCYQCYDSSLNRMDEIRERFKKNKVGQ